MLFKRLNYGIPTKEADDKLAMYGIITVFYASFSVAHHVTL